ncbi:hypothetical protein [Leptonema illini]|uniref:Uncharacterized protein n=1 Tax=Leptonema illini DSM 21528 TaxID=929563 RepID=H2CGP2_9LEPT|nr:hypothetical protein [Leptonema illini]EHQ04718.1 hypothetical protein Lepil_0003 [Leptonema illini DSM 21528]
MNHFSYRRLAFDNYWRKHYWTRYLAKGNDSRQPDRREFHEAIKQFESWTGSRRIPGKRSHHSISHMLSNLIPQAGFLFLWIVEELRYLEKNHQRAFNSIIRKFANADFSHEALELILEVAAVRRFFPVMTIDIDRPIGSGTIDLSVQLTNRQSFHLEITRLEESGESRFASRCLDDLINRLIYHPYCPRFAFKFRSAPTADEWNSLISELDNRLQAKDETIVIDNQFLLLVSSSSEEAFASLIETKKLKPMESSGWLMNDKSMERLIKKGRAKRTKYYHQTEDYCVSFHSIGSVYFWINDPLSLQLWLNTITSEIRTPVKFSLFIPWYYQTPQVPDDYTSFVLDIPTGDRFISLLSKNTPIFPWIASPSQSSGDESSASSPA